MNEQETEQEFKERVKNREVYWAAGEAIRWGKLTTDELINLQSEIATQLLGRLTNKSLCD